MKESMPTKERYPDLTPAQLILAIVGWQEERIEELEAKTSVTMGVGAGDGQMFVHGDYDSIKLLQGKLLELEELRRTPRKSAVLRVDGMENLTIEKWQANRIENVLRLTYNIYRVDVTTGETNYDRQLNQATTFIRDVLATAKGKHEQGNCGCTTCGTWRREVRDKV